MNILGVIPARGGSKQIQKKNIRNICGRPLIEYTIRTALNSDYLTDLIVSTDDTEIANISKSCGIVCDEFRPKKYASDFASTWSVINYELKRMEKKMKLFTTMLCCCSLPLLSDQLN